MKNNWVSLLALLVSIIALMLSYRVIPVDFKDYWGFVLGLLTLLVTMLIGWQIYNSLEIKDQLDSTKKNLLELEQQIARSERAFIFVDCGLNFVQGLSNVNERPLSAYRDFIYALDSAYKSNSHIVIEDCYNNLNAIIQKIQAGKGLNENVEQKNTQIENAIYELKKNPLYKDFEHLINPIENKRIELFEELKKNNDNSSNKG